MKMAFACFALLLFIGSSCESATYHVEPDGSGDYPTIQSAIAVAVDGDTVILAPGTYSGLGNAGFFYGGREILVRSRTSDPNSCVIDCMQQTVGVYFASGEGSDAILDGVTVRNGRGPQAGGILVNGANPTIRNCILSDNTCSAGLGGGRRVGMQFLGDNRGLFNPEQCL